MGNSHQLETVEDRLFPLVAQCPSVVKKLTGRKPDRRTVIRWAVNGCAGVKLKTVTMGRTRLTRRSWLLAFFERTDKARSKPPAPAKRRAKSRTRR